MNQSKIYKVEELDLKQNCTYVITSKRNTGKSVLTKEIVYNLLSKFDFHFILMISKTA